MERSPGSIRSDDRSSSRGGAAGSGRAGAALRPRSPHPV